MPTPDEHRPEPEPRPQPISSAHEDRPLEDLRLPARPAARGDVYARVTGQIVADLERGVRPWAKPWNAEHAAGRISRPLRSNGQPYRGMNVLLLWSSAADRGYAAPIWMTYNQAKELKAHVRAGERSTPVVYADKITRRDAREDGGEEEREIFFLKGYSAFNVEQIEGLPPHFYATAGPKLDPARRIERAEGFAKNTGAVVRHGGDGAHYSPASDHVQMPLWESFRDPEAYYSTLLHELAHWTKREGRLGRDFGRKKFDDEGYAREELVAEIASAFLSADLGLELRVREDHASYLDHWIKVLEEDHRAVFAAASHAQRAADYLHGLQPRRADA